MFWPTGASFSSPDFRWARGPRRSCSWFTPMDRASSPTAAITGLRAGAAARWLPATWCLPMARRWRGSLRRWRTRSGLLLRVAITRAASRRRLLGTWLVSARTVGGCAVRLEEVEAWKPRRPRWRPCWRGRARILSSRSCCAARERPKQHPSALHDWDYANLLALDARLSREGALKTRARDRCGWKPCDAAGTTIAMGTSPVESGRVVLRESARRPAHPFYASRRQGRGVAPGARLVLDSPKGEQRICVGCHTGPERAAENNVPAVLLRSTTPTDLTGAGAAGVARPAARAEKGSR